MKRLFKNCKLQRSTLPPNKDSLTFNPFHLDLYSDNTNIFVDSMKNALSTVHKEPSIKDVRNILTIFDLPSSRCPQLAYSIPPDVWFKIQ